MATGSNMIPFEMGSELRIIAEFVILLARTDVRYIAMTTKPIPNGHHIGFTRSDLRWACRRQKRDTVMRILEQDGLLLGHAVQQRKMSGRHGYYRIKFGHSSRQMSTDMRQLWL